MRAIGRLLVALVVVVCITPLHAAVVGTVINIEGKAITGATISLFAPEPMSAEGARLMSATPQRKPLGTVNSDSAGRFTLEVPKEYAVADVMIQANGYAPVATRIANDDELGGVLLTQAPTIHGTIKTGGTPVANATVALYGQGGSLASEYITRTDEQGRYSAPDPSKWASRVIVIHPDYAILDEQFNAGSKKGPDFTLNAGVKIDGKVVDQDGTTAAGDAQVLVDGWQLAKTAADGTFTVAHAPKEWELVEARSGFKAAQRAHASGALTLKLVRTATVAGTAKDVKTQLPLAGVRVAAAPAGRFGRAAVSDTFTDAKGNYSIAGLPPGAYDLRTLRPGFLINDVSAVTVRSGETAQRPLYGTARARVVGTVTNDDKQPVAAARVTAQQGSRMDTFVMLGGFRPGGSDGYTAPDGRFVLRSVEPDADIYVGATKRGYPSAKSPVMKLAAGERKSGVVLTIPRGLTVTGRVTDKENKPLSGVAVDATEAAADTMMGIRRMVLSTAQTHSDDVVRTGSDGTFTLHLKEGSYDFSFRREGFSAKTVRGTRVDATTKPVEVALDPGVEISGRVTRAGMGIEGVNVRAMSQDGMAATVTGADGSFTISDLTPGQMMLNVGKQEAFIQEMRQVTAPARDVNIELPAGGRITGRVVDKESHKPVTSFMAGVTTSRSGGGMVMMMPPMVRQFTSDDGSFVLENVKPGTTQVVVNAPGYTTARVANIEVEDGKTVENIEVAMEGGARLTGRVTGPDGAPLAGVTVRNDPMAAGARIMRFDGPDGGSTTTDPNGEYALESMEPGEKTIVFTRSGYTSSQKTVTVAAGKDTRLDAQLSSGMRVTGTVVSDAGAPIPDAVVRALGSSMDGGREGRTDASGNFAIEGLAPGHYTFTAGKSGFAPATQRDVDIATSGPVRIVMKSGGIITGHVTGLTQQELEQTTVTAMPASGGGMFMGGAQSPVDASGNYRIEGAPSGTVRVSARMGAMFGGTSKQAAPKTVEVEPGATAQLDIDFKSNTTIRGRITRNGGAVANAQVSFFPRGGRGQTSASTTADASGRYEVSGLEDGSYNVQVIDVASMSPYTTTLDVKGSDTFDITMKAVTLRGRVLDASGAPISDAAVNVTPAAGGSGFFGARANSTDANGTFIIDNVAAGSYTVTADKSGYGHETKQLTVGDSSPDEMEFRLSKSDGLTLHGVDARDNSPVSFNVMRVVDGAGNTLPSGGFFGGGSDTVKLSVAPGVYRVTVVARNYAMQTITVNAPSTMTVRFSPGGTLVIHSREASSRRARLIDTATNVAFGMNDMSLGVFTLNPGTMPINNIGAGRYRLEILDNADRVTKSVDVTVIEGRQQDVDV